MATQGFGRAFPIQRPYISVHYQQKSRPPGPAFLLAGRTKPVSDFVSRQCHHRIAATADAFGQRHGLWQQAVEVEAGCLQLAGVEAGGIALGFWCGGFDGFGPHVRQGGVAEHVEVVDSSGADGVGVVAGLFDDVFGNVGQALNSSSQWLKVGLQGGVAGVCFDEGGYVLYEQFVQLTLTGNDLAAHQVHGLDAVGAFVDLGDAAVAYQLLLAPFADEAVATKDLLADDGGVQAAVGQEGFGDGGQQGNHAFGVFALFVVVRVLGDIQPLGNVGGECTATLYVALHGQQHATHVWVYQDRVGGFFGLLGTGGGAALDTLVGVFTGALQGGFSSANALDANAQALVVHHGEHGGQAFVFFANQPAFGAVKVHHAGRGGLDTHLFLDGTTAELVALAQGTVVIHHELGYQEQGNALRTFGGVRQLGQHQMDDVLSHVVLAPGNEDLGTGDVEGAVVVRLGLGTDNAQVGTRVRLGQVHGAGPYAGVHVRQVFLFQFLAAVGIQGQAGIGGEHRGQAEGHVGALHHFFKLGHQCFRHAHTAEIGVAAEAIPATFHDGLVGFFETFRSGNFAFVPLTALLVRFAVQGGQHATGDFARFFKDRVCGVGIYVFCNLGQRRPECGRVEYFVQNETHVTKGCLIISHVQLSRNSVSHLGDFKNAFLP